MKPDYWTISERIAHIAVTNVPGINSVPDCYIENVMLLVKASLWLAFDYDRVEARRKWEEAPYRLPILKKLGRIPIPDKVKIEIEGRTYDVTCKTMLAEVTYELIRLQNSEFADQFRRHSILNAFEDLAEYLIVNNIYSKSDTAKLIEYILAEADIPTPANEPYTAKKIREKIPFLKR